MKQSSTELLEYDALLALVGRYVYSQMGRRELEQIAPSTDRAALERAHSETAEAITYVRAAESSIGAARGAATRIRFDSIPDAEIAARKVAIEGATLESKEILDLTALLERAAEIRKIGRASCRERV